MHLGLFVVARSAEPVGRGRTGSASFVSSSRSASKAARCEHPASTPVAGAALRRGRRYGFTLVELLVVIAIIALLVALLVPAVQGARESSRRITCANNLRQIGIGLQSYTSQNGSLPICNPWTVVGTEQPWNWIPRLLPFVEQQSLFDQLDWTVQGNDAVNRSFSQQIHPLFICPSNPLGRLLTSQEKWLNTVRSNVDYAAVNGDYLNATGVGVSPGYGNVAGAWGNPTAVRGMIGRWGWSASPAHVTDGLSNTFCIGECIGALSTQQNWAIQSFGTTAHPINYMNRSLQDDIPTHPANPRYDEAVGFRSFHPGGAHFALGDGATVYVDEQIDGVVYRAYASRNGNETIVSLP